MNLDLETVLSMNSLQLYLTIMKIQFQRLIMALTSSTLFLSTVQAASAPRFYKPADAAEHVGTFMGWPTRHSIVGNGQGWQYTGAALLETRKEIANIAKAIAKYEPVQMLVRDPKTVTDPKDPDNLKSAKHLLGNEPNVTLIVTPNADSLWMRDTAPLFVYAEADETVKNTWPPHADAGIGLKPLNTESSVVGLDLNFNQWGRKLAPSPDSKLSLSSKLRIDNRSRMGSCVILIGWTARLMELMRFRLRCAHSLPSCRHIMPDRAVCGGRGSDRGRRRRHPHRH